MVSMSQISTDDGFGSNRRSHNCVLKRFSARFQFNMRKMNFNPCENFEETSLNGIPAEENVGEDPQ